MIMRLASVPAVRIIFATLSVAMFPMSDWEYVGVYAIFIFPFIYLFVFFDDDAREVKCSEYCEDYCEGAKGYKKGGCGIDCCGCDVCAGVGWCESACDSCLVAWSRAIAGESSCGTAGVSVGVSYISSCISACPVFWS